MCNQLPPPHAIAPATNSECPVDLIDVVVVVSGSKEDEHSIRMPFIPKLPSPPPPPSAPKPRLRKTTIDVSQTFVEAWAIVNIAFPMILTGLLLYSRSLISMLFLGRLGRLALAGGSLAIGFANITGYSVLSGLAMGMEPVCSQAFGARKHSLLGLALQQTLLLLLLVSLPIAALWFNMERILLICGQDSDIANVAQEYILFSIPDLLLQSFLHPLRIYLRSQAINLPLTYCATAAIVLHLPINYLLVSFFQLGVRGVALAGVWTNFNLVAFLLLYVHFAGVHRRTGGVHLMKDCLNGWRSLVGLAVPSCVSVCLEWWWYEIMVLLCGLLMDPKSTVASMGILIQTTSLLYIFPSSLSFAVSTRVGNELGANRPERARRAGAVGIAGSFIIGITALAFAYGVRNAWAKLFTSDAAIVGLTSTVLPVLGLCELGNCPQTTGCGVLRGSARPRAGANINLGSFYAVGMPVAVSLAFYGGFDFKGLWLGLLAAQATCVALMLIVIGRTDWSAQAHRAQLLTAADDDGEEIATEKSKNQQKLNSTAVVGEGDNVNIMVKVDKSAGLICN